jgi:hypothetical protein
MTEQAREDVENLLEKFRDILEFAGIPSYQINVSKGPLYQTHHFIKAFDWLHEFSICSQLEEMRKVYILRTPEQWKMYGYLGLEGTQEQELRDIASKALNKRWRMKRPRMFGRDKNEESSTR